MERLLSPTSSRVVDLVIYGVFLTSIYIVARTIYLSLLHPLNQFPGPPAARISKLWSRYGNLKGRKSHRIHAAHQRYGPVVRVAPNELSFSDPAAVRDIYTNDAFVKEEAFYRAKRVFHEEMVMSFRDPEAHKQRKKLLQRGFSQASMLAFEPQIDDKVRTLLVQWGRRAREGNGTVDVYPWLLWLAFDVVYHLMFDEDPGSVKQGEAHWIMGYMRAWRPTFIYKEFVPQLERWGVYIPGDVGDNFRKVEAWKRFATQLIISCRGRDTKTPFLQTTLTDTDGFLGRRLTDSELAEESMGGMFGGSGTTANTFVYLLWATLSKPEVVRRLKQELREAFPDRSKIDSVTCAKLPYLQAVISETLRLYPTIIASLPRMAVRDTTVAGVLIPKGASLWFFHKHRECITIVGTQNYTIHRSEEAFTTAEEFIPDRWLSEENAAAMKEAFTPFSVGSRSCLGINLAKMELNKLTAAFFLRFDATVDKSMTEEEMEMNDVFSASPAGGRLLLNLSESRI